MVWESSSRYKIIKDKNEKSHKRCPICVSQTQPDYLPKGYKWKKGMGFAIPIRKFK
jgi:hypothetical protein